MSHPDRQRMKNGRGKIIVEERGAEEQGERRGAVERELAKPFTYTYESIHPYTHSQTDMENAAIERTPTMGDGGGQRDASCERRLKERR